jgi:hypothetical protein
MVRATSRSDFWTENGLTRKTVSTNGVSVRVIEAKDYDVKASNMGQPIHCMP